jgi:hypothetical protein
MDGNGYSHDIETPEGRIKQLETWVAVRFPMPEHQQKFMDTPQPELDEKTPRERAAESVEGLLYFKAKIFPKTKKSLDL